MADDIKASAPKSTPDPKREIAAGIYAAWRNKHLNELPVAMFNRLEEASGYLIDEIAARL